MSETESRIINIITSKLPGDLARPIYQEFRDRYAESVRIITRYEKYASLRDDLEIVEYLLAMSIFYKRVILNLDAAEKFYGLVTKTERTSGIRLGSYLLDHEQVVRIRRTLLALQKLLARYNTSPILFNYDLTVDFVKKMVDLKRSHEIYE